MQIWDTVGQERYSRIPQTSYKGTTGILLCYAIDNRESLGELSTGCKR